jgi:hypothetical protein
MFYIFFSVADGFGVFTVWKVWGFRKFPIPTINIYAALKGTQAWDNFEFFFNLNQNLICPWSNFEKKFRLFYFDFRQNFDVRTFSQWLSILGTKFFWWAIKKSFFSKIFTLVLLDGFLDGFSKFRLFIVKICILISVSHPWCEHFLSTTAQPLRYRERWRKRRETPDW